MKHSWTAAATAPDSAENGNETESLVALRQRALSTAMAELGHNKPAQILGLHEPASQ